MQRNVAREPAMRSTDCGRIGMKDLDVAIYESELELSTNSRVWYNAAQGHEGFRSCGLVGKTLNG
jgi:hypothetical protein